jgi:hypothetical protein
LHASSRRNDKHKQGFGLGKAIIVHALRYWHIASTCGFNMPGTLVFGLPLQRIQIMQAVCSSSLTRRFDQLVE